MPHPDGNIKPITYDAFDALYGEFIIKNNCCFFAMCLSNLHICQSVLYATSGRTQQKSST